MYVCLPVYEYANVGHAPWRSEGSIRPLELELQLLMWVLGSELRSSVRAASAPYY